MRQWMEASQALKRLDFTTFVRECRACGGTTQGWLIFCHCVCGDEHGICHECSIAMEEIGMLESSVGEVTHDAENGGPITTRYTESRILQCIKKEEVRMALAIGRSDGAN